MVSTIGVMSQRTKTTKKPAKLLDYANLLGQVKERIRRAQVRAVLSVNAELIWLYWDIGRILDERQVKEGYGTAIIPRLARDLRIELPEVKGFSERNIGRMIAFFRAYPRPTELLPQPVAKVIAKKVSPRAVAKLTAPAKVPQPVAQIPAADSVLWSVPWGRHALLLEKVKADEVQMKISEPNNARHLDLRFQEKVSTRMARSHCSLLVLSERRHHGAGIICRRSAIRHCPRLSSVARLGSHSL